MLKHRYPLSVFICLKSAYICVFNLCVFICEHLCFKSAFICASTSVIICVLKKE
jgi:hypothetical protein